MLRNALAEKVTYAYRMQLDHPAIVRFHDSFMEKDVFCIVTEYCEVKLCWLYECYACGEKLTKRVRMLLTKRVRMLLNIIHIWMQ